MPLNILTRLIISLALIAPSPQIFAEAEEGKRLFENHGCTNCHGENGIHPTSRYVPILKGKSAEYLYNNASAIFSGKHISRQSRVMHEQFCIGEVKEEGCYAPPGDADLMTIAKWLSGNLSEKKKTPQGLYVSSVEAYERLGNQRDKKLFIDVRSRAEVAFLGMPSDADANIPYMEMGYFDEWDDKKKNFRLTPNSEFVMRVEQLATTRSLGKDTEIYLICRSGNRSAKASKLLSLAGYNNVYNITDGFEGDKARQGTRKGERMVNGWKNSGLPWSYKLNKSAMYWDL